MLKSLSIAAIAVIFCGPAYCAQVVATAQSQPSASAATQAKAPPQAKTKEEYKAYNDATAVHGGAAAEKAARNFAGKFPGSELTVYLYSRALREYKKEDNPSRVLETGRTVLSLDPDNAIALVLVATVLSDGLNATDTDRARKVSEIRENCSRAEKSLAAAASSGAYQSTMKSMIYSALGIMELKLGNDAAAEKQLKAATQMENVQPDAYVWYHLALAMDHQKEYPEALAAVNQALSLVKSNPELQKLANGEYERLTRLASSSPSQPPQPEPGKSPR